MYVLSCMFMYHQQYLTVFIKFTYLTVLPTNSTPFNIRERIKCLILDSEMCTLQKVSGKDSIVSVVLWMPKTSLKHVI